MPVLSLACRPTAPLHVPTYVVALIGKYLCYALLALSLDLVWGYCGILSLGHGAFFALGGYAMGMYLMRQIGSRGVYGNPDLPDFMVFLNWKELPWYWYGFDQFWFAALMVMLVPGLLAFVFGWFAFRSRVTGVYLSIITQALTYALLLAFFRNDMGFGGNNGLTDFKDILGFNVQADDPRGAVRGQRAGAGARRLVTCGGSSRSKYGKVLVAVRDAESRTRFLGYRVERYKLFAFVVSAMMAGIAGALYVPQVGIINPGEFAPANSIEVVIWTAVGGRGTLVGPIIGAISSISARPGSPARCRSSGSLRSAGCSSASRCSCPRASSACGTSWLDGARESQRRAAGRPRTAPATIVPAAASPDGPNRRRSSRTAAGGVGSHEPQQQHPLSRRRLGLLRRLPRHQQSVAGAGARRDAGDHRPERRRQDDDDGHRHRQDPARRRRGVLQRQTST